MSSQSGIAVPKDIIDAFTTALSTPTTRCLVLTIPSTTSYTLHAVLPSGQKPHPSAPKDAPQYISDIASLLPALPSSNTCAAFLIRNDTNEWSLLSYIPDSAPVRQKMLHASSKSTLLKSLAPHHEISETLFFTSPGDLTPTGFQAHLRHREAPAPMTKSEEALRDIKASEQREAQERLELMFGKTSISSNSSDQSAPSRKPSNLTPAVFGAPAPLRQRSTDSSQTSSPITSPTGGLARGGIGAMGAILGGASGLGAGADKGSLKWGDGVAEVLKKLTEADTEGRVVVLVRLPFTSQEVQTLIPAVVNRSEIRNDHHPPNARKHPMSARRTRVEVTAQRTKLRILRMASSLCAETIFRIKTILCPEDRAAQI